MAKLDFDRIRQSAREMTDAELETALAVKREDYVPEALEVMASELERRGVNPREHVLSTEATRVILPWLTVYVALTGIGAVLALLSRVQNLISVATLGFFVVVAYYLSKRAAWAWWANVFVLGTSTLGLLSGATQSPVGAVFAGLWGIGNGIYFYRERRHFTER